MKPTVVCLCGSTRFSEAFRKANLEETLAGKIVLSVGCDTKSDGALGLSPETKAALDFPIVLCNLECAGVALVNVTPEASTE